MTSPSENFPKSKQRKQTIKYQLIIIHADDITQFASVRENNLSHSGNLPKDGQKCLFMYLMHDARTIGSFAQGKKDLRGESPKVSQ